MKRMFGILALMVVASIMIAGCVQPTGNQTATPGTTPGLTETPMTTPVETATPVTTPVETTTPMTTPVETTTPMATATTLAPGETVTTPTTAANVTETPPGPPAATVADETVSITESGFVPSTLSVPSGSTVAWTNDAATNQTVTATGNTGFFDSGLLQPGDSFSYTFTTTGDYNYTSQTTGFSGTVNVTANTSS